MAATLNLGNGNWGVKEDSLLAYNSENGNFKPLPFDFTRASSATVVNKQGLIETVQSGIPRIDFKDDAKGALLLEPQSTNLITYSEDFSNASWLKSGLSVTSGFTSPNGTANAFKLVEDTSIGEHFIQATGITTIVDKYSFTLFAKASESSKLRVRGANYFSNVTGADFDLIAKTATNLSSAVNASIVEMSDGWFKCTFTSLANAFAGTNAHYRVYLLDDSGATSYTGDGTSGVYIYGTQLEQKSYATSYIPTQGAISTRLSEGSIITNLGTKNIITNSGSWTAFFELELLGNESPVDKIQLSDNSNVPRVYLYGASAGVSGTGWSGGAVLSMNTNNKIIYRGNSTQNISFFENGVNEATLSSASAPITFNRLNLYGANGAFKIKQIQLFKTSLSDAECITLTSL